MNPIRGLNNLYYIHPEVLEVDFEELRAYKPPKMFQAARHTDQG